jgi:hypothetical protein
MKLKSNHKAMFLFVGMLFAWFALYIMLYIMFAGFFEDMSFGRAPLLFGEWGACVLISSACVAMGLRAEGDNLKQSRD